MFTLFTVNLCFQGINNKPKNVSFLGLVNSFASLGNYVGIVPELAARQAQGIIMREASLLMLVCPFQFGTTFLLDCMGHRFILLILYSLHGLMSNHSKGDCLPLTQVEEHPLHKL
jgi:hypothetical protein